MSAHNRRNDLGKESITIILIKCIKNALRLLHYARFSIQQCFDIMTDIRDAVLRTTIGAYGLIIIVMLGAAWRFSAATSTA